MALGDVAYAATRRRTIFECCKWDPQVEDVSTLCRFPLFIPSRAWLELVAAAEALAREALVAEEELLTRPELHGRLGLPRAVRHALALAGQTHSSPGVARLIRFDFHLTNSGWRISEANTDVPGGVNEAEGFAEILAGQYTGARTCGAPATEYARGLIAATHPPRRIALVHATAYCDDHQVMAFIARILRALGACPLLVSPAQLTWRGGRAMVDGEAVDVLARFFPAEWLPNLPRACAWRMHFVGATTPSSNPARAILTQSKRFPLVWNDLHAMLPVWRSLLPETRDPRDVSWRDDPEWVLKPALGRVGDGIGITGVTTAKDWNRIQRDVQWHPDRWVAQRRFEAIPLVLDGERLYPCIGVYTVDGRAAGAYGRIARRPLIDWTAQDVAILIDPIQTEALVGAGA